MNDHWMVRSHNDVGYNLAVGEPFFLQEALAPIIDAIDPLSPMQYPQLAGDTVILEELHKRYGMDKHIVVANGAKQALLASLYAMEFYKEKDGGGLYTTFPYWPSYPTLARLSDLEFFSNSSSEPNDVVIATSPNNPDGALYDGVCDIWDAAYAHEVYGFDSYRPRPQARVSIWSSAKLFGTSALRIGWLVTDDKEFADRAAHYVEITTSGVCVPAQRQVAGILRDIRKHPEKATTLYAKARDTLLLNAATFNRLIAPHCKTVKGVPASLLGMFAYFKPDDEVKFQAALQASGVRVVPGTACGSNPGWYRMSMGHRTGFTEEALSKLEEHL